MAMFTFFFFNDTATTEIYTLSLHDALPICHQRARVRSRSTILSSDKLRTAARLMSAIDRSPTLGLFYRPGSVSKDRKSTRLNSSHANISYAVFCLKKKKYPKFDI